MQRAAAIFPAAPGQNQASVTCVQCSPGVAAHLTQHATSAASRASAVPRTRIRRPPAHRQGGGSMFSGGAVPRPAGNPCVGRHWVPGGGPCPLSLHGCGRQRQQCLHNGPGARAAGTDAPAPSPRRRSGSSAQAAQTHCWNTPGLPPPRGAAYTGGSAACAPTLYLQVRRAGRPAR